MSIAAKCVHGAKLCVIPKEDNDYRPLALRHGSLAFFSTLIVVVNVLAAGLVALMPLPAQLSTITSARIIQLTNAERVKAGLNELKINSALTNSAQQKGLHMLEEDYFAHISPSGVTPWFWFNKFGYKYQVAGENLAIDFIQAEDVVSAWIASPTHKANMLHDAYTETGVAVVTGEFQGGNSTIIVHHFGLPQGASVPAITSNPTPAVQASTSPIPTSTTPAPLPASPPTPTPDLIPPSIPRIVSADNTVQDSISLEIDSEENSTVFFLINNQARGQSAVGSSGQTATTLKLNDFPDGTIIIRGYAQDSAGNQSELSEPLAITKDTTALELDQQIVSFLLSPATDTPTAVASITTNDEISVDVETNNSVTSFTAGEQIIIPVSNSPILLTAIDSAGNVSTTYEAKVVPDFSIESRYGFPESPSRFSRSARWLTAALFIILIILLSLTILIKIRIQRPSIISHASLVILLTAALLFL